MASIGLERAAGLGRLAVTPLANAAAAVAVVAYLVCAALAIVAPDLLLWIFRSWAHGLALDTLRPAGARFGPAEFAIGLVTFGGSVWLATAATAWLYNTWARR